MKLSIHEILFGSKHETPNTPISFVIESHRVGILSTEKKKLDQLAHTLSGLTKLNHGKIMFGGHIWHQKKNLMSNDLIAYISNDWSFLQRLSLKEIYTLFTNIGQFSLPHFSKISFRLRAAITQLLLAKAPIWIFNQVDFGDNIDEWLDFIEPFRHKKIIVILSDNSHFIEKLCHEVVIIEQNKLLEQATVQELIDGLEGIVWEKLIDSSEIGRYEELFFILKKTPQGNKVKISILSEHQPCEGFHQTQASLEVLFQHKLILNKLSSQ